MATAGELPEQAANAGAVDPNAAAVDPAKARGARDTVDDGAAGGKGAGNGGGGAGDGPAEKVTGALTDALLKAIAYLATGAGFLTFIGATGAAVTWMRLNAAELPATQALQLVGVKHLVADGAVALIAFAVLGLIAVTFIYVVDVPHRDTDEMRHGVTLLAVIESLIAIWVANSYLDDVPHLPLAMGGVVALGILTIAISVLPERPPPRESWPKFLKCWGKFRRFLGPKIADFALIPPLSTNQQLRDEIERRKLRAQLDLAPEEEKRKKKVKLKPMLTLAAAAFAWGLFYVYWYHDWVGWSIWLAWGLAALCFGVARTTERFWIYGMAIFVSVALFGAWLNVVRLTDSPQLSPAALLRTGNDGTSGVVGLYIARTDDRYWFGAVTMECEGADGEVSTRLLKPHSGRIFSVPRSQVVDDTIGARTRMGEVGDNALELLGELVRRQPPGGAPPPEAPPSPATATTPTATTTSSTARETTPTARAAAAGASRPTATTGTTADSQAAVPSALAVTGSCMHLPPRLTRLNPATAAPGDPVEIIGTDLGVKRRENDRVTINGVTVEPPPDAWQDESIVVQVPKTLGPRRAMIRVVARGHTSNALAVKIARNGPPVAAFSSRSDRSARSFLLDASGSRDPEGKPLSYGWRSRGNTLGREKTQPITLPKGRRSTAVTLTVTDDRGQRATAKRTVSLGVDRITLLNDATFSFGKTTLTGAGRTRIAELRSRLRGQAGTIERIDISGYADFAGTSRFNLDLSLQRAEAVRAALMKDLKPVRPVKVNGYGESRARAKTWNDPRRGRDRRVDIKVTLQR